MSQTLQKHEKSHNMLLFRLMLYVLLLTIPLSLFSGIGQNGQNDQNDQNSSVITINFNGHKTKESEKKENSGEESGEGRRRVKILITDSPRCIMRCVVTSAVFSFRLILPRRSGGGNPAYRSFIEPLDRARVRSRVWTPDFMDTRGPQV